MWTGVKRMERQKVREKKNNQASFYRLCAALLVLGLALVLRTFFPEQTRSFLNRAVAGGMDYTALLGDVGDSLRSFVLGVPHPNAEIEADKAESGRQAASAPQTDPDIGGSPQGETYDPEKEPPPDDKAIGLGGLDLPVLYADASLFISQSYGEDDTLPLPFGMQKPDRVDYTVYDLPFETALPAVGAVSSVFGYRIHPIFGDWRFHYGLDIAANAGTPITAFADGIVAATGKNAGYGNYLLISHSDDYVTLYAHCQKITVRDGDEVKRGDKIATVGSTGLSTGPHLHFELRRGSAILNPSSYIVP
jgi:murein DD-endopeptidase MepM/ murein hydrolase activator NlpD